MTYKLDGTNLEAFGAHPCADQDATALNGVFDLPKRKGTVEYNWGTSIEPFVDENDIELDGRALTLKVCVKGDSVVDYLAKLGAYKSACIACRKLWTEFGEFGVVLKDTIDVEEYAEIFMVIVTTKFWQQDIVLPKLTIPSSGGIDNLLDGYNLGKDFGIYIASTKDDKNIPKRIEVSTTAPYMQTHYREPGNLIFECSMVGDDLHDLYSKISQFQALCMSSGLHALQLSGNDFYNLYFKDGMAVKAPSNTLLKFDLKCRAVK